MCLMGHVLMPGLAQVEHGRRGSTKTMCDQVVVSVRGTEGARYLAHPSVDSRLYPFCLAATTMSKDGRFQLGCHRHCELSVYRGCSNHWRAGDGEMNSFVLNPEQFKSYTESSRKSDKLSPYSKSGRRIFIKAD